MFRTSLQKFRFNYSQDILGKCRIFGKNNFENLLKLLIKVIFCKTNATGKHKTTGFVK